MVCFLLRQFSGVIWGLSSPFVDIASIHQVGLGGDFTSWCIGFGNWYGGQKVSVTRRQRAVNRLGHV